MSSANGPEGPSDQVTDDAPSVPFQTMELQLFESLVHHLIEKGILTKNDALSVVQTVAEVKRGQRETGGPQSAFAEVDLVILQRLYSSFEVVTDRPIAPEDFDRGKVLQLRPPIHGENPKFPKDD